MRHRVGHGSGLISPVYIGQAIGAGGGGDPATLLRTYRGLAADLYEDTAATNPVEDDADAVQAWEDTGGGNLVTEGTDFPLWNQSELAVAGQPSKLSGADTGLPRGNDPLSVACWANLNAISGDQVLVAWGDNGVGTQAQLYVNSYGNVVIGKVSVTLVSLTTLSASTWYHLAATHDGTTTRLYIDGVEDNNMAITFNIAAGTFDLGCVAAAGTAVSLAGLLDGVKIYSGVLTAGEVSTLFGLGR